MATTNKTTAVNYTAEQTAKMAADYSANPSRETIEALALAMGKSARSIIAKLSREKVYVKPERTTKTGQPVVKKDELIDKLMSLAGLTEAEATSMTHSNKTALNKLIKALAE
jgi:hypothetical protein